MLLSGKVSVWCVNEYMKCQSMINAQRAYRREFKLKRLEKVPDKVTMFCDTVLTIKKKQQPGCPQYIRTQANIERVREAIHTSLTHSIHEQSLALDVPCTSLNCIIHTHLQMRLYKMQVIRRLEPGDHEQPTIFFETTLTMIVDGHFDVANIMFSDKAHFDSFGNVNKQNIRYYFETNPKVIVDKPLHSPRVTRWYAVDGKMIIGPYFFEDERDANITVNSNQLFYTRIAQ